MIREAIDRITELAAPTVLEVEGKTYARHNAFTEVKPERPVPKTITVNSLDALVKLIKEEATVVYNKRIFVSCCNHNKVLCYLQADREDYRRFTLYEAMATDVPGFRDRWYTQEEAIIALQSQFQENEGTEYILNLIKRLSNKSEVETKDNGVSQNVTVKKGVELLTVENVKSIVPLCPYRTFHELIQPESNFLLRARDNGEIQIGLFEADGEAWKLKARETCRFNLRMELRDLVEAGRVVVML